MPETPGLLPVASVRSAPSRRGQIAFSGVVVLALLGTWLALPSPAVPPAETQQGPATARQNTPAVIVQTAATAPATVTPSLPEQPVTLADTDPRHALALGNWVGFYQGRRTLVLREDGTGTMTSEPEGIAARLLAAKLIFEIQWKLDGQQVVFETISGEPASKVAIITRMYGKQRSHKVRALSADEMVLLDEDGKTEYKWTRPAATTESTPSPTTP